MFFVDGVGLGDDPPRDRTAELRVLGFPRRHLGSVQMTTDTALGVTKRVVEDRGSYLSLSLCARDFASGCSGTVRWENTDGFARTVPLEQIPYVVRSTFPASAPVVPYIS
jgi:hypothetical protein